MKRTTMDGVDAGSLRVLLVAPLPPPVGGIATWTKILLSELNKDFRIEVKHVDTKLRWKKLIVSSGWERLAGGTFQAVWDLGRMGWGMVSFRPHVIHVTSTAAFASLKDVLFLLLARFLGISCLMHYHRSFLALQDVRGWQFLVARFAMHLADCVVVLDPKSEALLKQYVPPDKLHLLPNMIDLQEIDRIGEKDGDERSGYSSHDRHLVFVGHVVPQKGIRELVEACRVLSHIQLHLVGPVKEAFMRGELSVLSDSRRSPDHWLHFYGSVENNVACRHIFQGDVVCLPSYYEGFPMVLLESMALGKPIVASDVGAIPEMLNIGGERPCGICVPPKDREALQNALQWMLDHPERWEEMGRNGRKRVESLYSAEVVVGALVNLWQKIGRYSDAMKNAEVS